MSYIITSYTTSFGFKISGSTYAFIGNVIKIYNNLSVPHLCYPYSYCGCALMLPLQVSWMRSTIGTWFFFTLRPTISMSIAYRFCSVKMIPVIHRGTNLHMPLLISMIHQGTYSNILISNLTLTPRIEEALLCPIPLGNGTICPVEL